MPHQVHEQEIISGTRGKGQGMEITLADKIKFYQLFIAAVVKLKWTEICHQIGALHHRLTYRASGSPKNVVVVGGSFAGAFLAQRLASTLPSTHRVILIEKNSHFHYLFNFPRYAVVRGREQRAFIPYSHLSSRCPQGIFEHVQDTVSQITSEKVELKSGKSVRFDFLAIATGTSRPPPANLQSTTKTAACAELQALQALVGAAKRIAVIGGGPVGVQTATDIKSTYPGKSVFLIHAHSRLLPGFGERVQNYATKAVKDMGITIFAGERPSLPKRIELSKGRSTLQFEDRPAENFDLVVC